MLLTYRFPFLFGFFTFLGLVLMPTLAFAAVATDHPSYTAPAIVGYSGFNGSNGGAIYTGTTLLCETTGAPVSSGDLATNFRAVSCGGGSGTFDTASSTPGSYKLLMITAAACFGMNYAACAAANPGIPGINEADFDITAGGGGGPAGSSTPFGVLTLFSPPASSSFEGNIGIYSQRIFNEILPFAAMIIGIIVGGILILVFPEWLTGAFHWLMERLARRGRYNKSTPFD